MTYLFAMSLALFVSVTVIAPFIDERIARRRRRRAEFERSGGRIPIRRAVPPPPIHFTRDPSPKPRKRAP